MRKFAVITAALAVLAGATAVMSIASASAAPMAAAEPSVKVLHLIATKRLSRSSASARRAQPGRSGDRDHGGLPARHAG